MCLHRRTISVNCCIFYFNTDAAVQSWQMKWANVCQNEMFGHCRSKKKRQHKAMSFWKFGTIWKIYFGNMFLRNWSPATSPCSSSPCFPWDHAIINSLQLFFCSLTPSCLLLSPAAFLSTGKSSMYVQVDHEHICFLPSLSFLLQSLCPHLTPLPLCSHFQFHPGPIPSFSIFLSMDWFLFMQGRSRLTDIVSWPRQAKPLSVPDI